jgi:hypothetical protein
MPQGSSFAYILLVSRTPDISRNRAATGKIQNEANLRSGYRLEKTKPFGSCGWMQGVYPGGCSARRFTGFVFTLWRAVAPGFRFGIDSKKQSHFSPAAVSKKQSQLASRTGWLNGLDDIHMALH